MDILLEVINSVIDEGISKKKEKINDIEEQHLIQRYKDIEINHLRHDIYLLKQCKVKLKEIFSLLSELT